MKKKRIISLILTLLIIVNLMQFHSSSVYAKNAFSDVPSNHWAYDYVHELRDMGITKGMSNNRFGLGSTISRYEFIAFLVRLMKWEIIKQPNPTFLDATDTKAWYYDLLETAVEHGLLNAVGAEFDKNPDVSKRKLNGNSPITRQEMAIMIVRALGYGQIAAKLDLEPSFSDVKKFTGYINVAKDLGIINGISETQFAPTSTAKREEAAAMMIRMYRKLNSKIEDLHAFYAIRSYGQIGYLNQLNSVSFGWSHLGYENGKGYFLDSAYDKNEDFVIPIGYENALSAAQNAKVKTHLMIYANDTQKIGEGGNLTSFLLSPVEQDKVINQIVNEISTNKLNLQGVTIDFEEIKGAEKRQQFNVFLKKLKIALNGKRLMVAVHPQRKQGIAYYDGYDFKEIGRIADKVILMAHNYYAKSLTEQEANNGYTLTPLASLDKIYYALRFITDKNTGVEDRSKVMLQLSFDAVQWQKQNNVVINQEAFQPSYDKIIDALNNTNAIVDFTEQYSSPKAYYTDGNGVENIIWYEDARSMVAKIQLAKMYDIHSISIWRLGNIPNDYKAPNMNVWDEIVKQK